MKYNVLIYPCSADNALEIYKAIKHSVHFNVYGANSHKDVGDLLYENAVLELPNITDPAFINRLNELIKNYQIDFIFPTHDDVIYFLANHRASINSTIIGGDKLINEVCRFKHTTYQFFKNEKFIPKIYHSISEIDAYPVFVKPNKGQGSLGAQLVVSEDTISTFDFKTFVVSEYLEGDEYTVDCLSDKDHQLVYSFPRRRHLIRNGVSKINMEPPLEIQKQATEIANLINDKLKFKGLWFFQVKANENGQLKLLEICPRIANTMSYARFKGVNLPLLTLFTYLNWPVKIQIKHNNVELYRYSNTIPDYHLHYSKVYMDLDDTLIIKNKVCLAAIAFLYQCKNKGIDVYLISRHEFNINETLAKYHIPKSLFKEVIHLKDQDHKYEYIDPNGSIFIDNYFKERDEVFNQISIPVFDVEAIEGLLII